MYSNQLEYIKILEVTFLVNLVGKLKERRVRQAVDHIRSKPMANKIAELRRWLGREKLAELGATLALRKKGKALSCFATLKFVIMCVQKEREEYSDK
jgi:hypothetical protein